MVRQLVADSVQMLGLRSVVVEHTVDLVVTKQPQDMANILRQAQLRDLVFSPGRWDSASTSNRVLSRPTWRTTRSEGGYRVKGATSSQQKISSVIIFF